MKGGVALLVLGSLMLWVLTAIPAAIWFNPNSTLLATVAMVLCLVPGVATFHLAARVGRQSSETLMAVIVGGTLVRLTTALGGGAALYLSLPDYFPLVFWVWLALFYIFTLTVEIALLARTNSGEPRA